MNLITENEKTALTFYGEQWIYRNKHYWNLVIKDVYIVLVVILFPNITGKIDMLPKTIIPQFIFPILGIIISAFFVYLLLCEGERMGKQMESINEILQKTGYERKSVSKKYNVSLSKMIPWLILIFHILVACTYLFPAAI